MKQERKKNEDQCEGRKLEFDTAPPKKKKQIGLSPQLGIRDAYRTHLEKAFSVDRITMKGTRKAKPGEQLFRFCYQTQPS